MTKNIKTKKILKQVQNDKSVETGRSMTEMLGVLAIIGVLSIGGIAGYTYAMDKHHANEIIHGVSMMAISASQQLENNDTFSLREFGDEVAGYAVTSAVEDDGYFTITVSGVSEGACEKLKDLEWKVPSEINVNGTYNGTCRDDSAIEFVFPPTLDTSGEPERDENGCYNVSYKTGDCCQVNNKVKVCPGDEEPEIPTCTPKEKVVDTGVEGYCLCEDYPYDQGDGFVCAFSYWNGELGTGYRCENGPDKGKYMKSCSCDEENKIIDGTCDNITGKWICSGGVISGNTCCIWDDIKTEACCDVFNREWTGTQCCMGNERPYGTLCCEWGATNGRCCEWNEYKTNQECCESFFGNNHWINGECCEVNDQTSENCCKGMMGSDYTYDPVSMSCSK